jgi:hypothetical protein
VAHDINTLSAIHATAAMRRRETPRMAATRALKCAAFTDAVSDAVRAPRATAASDAARQPSARTRSSRSVGAPPERARRGERARGGGDGESSRGCCDA